ncbi:frequency clock protein [Daldinia caldariorum]|uniref:frequency clock protein n=1 Tax=Daldinia caldariorum TaxID=326644 RepID=UPI002008DCC6|nr:frequency clock protein [Daldinia caldariorum]KAI1469286.1 frequency clock protein [Daldinia caldariorum]
MADSRDAPTAPNVTYNNPRRKSPEASITLQYHRQARNASRREPQTTNPPIHSAISKPRRNSSGDSNETGLSDPKNWFESSNQKAMLTTDIDEAPFFQKETESSNEEVAKYGLPMQSPGYRTRPVGLAHSNQSVDEFRSVIDDLTVENKRLKEELKKYKQMGPGSLRRDKLFEVKVHGLSSRKKRELEATLRDFTTSLEGSSTGPSSRKKTSGKSKNIHSSASKHASSSSGSNSRPIDSAYASMSAGASSSVPSLPGQAKAARERSEQNIQNYLRDIPEGLWPRPTIMTEKEKKKLVVKRLEHLFTGKMANPAERVLLPQVPEPIAEDVQMGGTSDRIAVPNETIREAQIRPRDSSQKESSSRDNGSASNSHSHSNSHSNGDQTDPRDSGNNTGNRNGRANESGNNTSPHMSMLPPEQRPTRPRDLDPDRRQVPSENMDYIRHLGLVAPESQKQFSARDVSPDAEGWVYLNLLCNLAQLHILNVTPAFIRSAVSEKSTKFQLSPDGRKIRWRGGVEGTKFSSDSGSNSQRNQSSDDTDGSNDQEQRKKQKTQGSGNDVTVHKPSKFGLGVQQSNSSESFHYKPLFVHHHQTSSSDEQPSAGDETGSSFGPPEDSNLGGLNSRWGQSGVSGLSQRKRRRDGAIIYYSGAPFCTDLSGDFGDGDGEVSPATYDMTSSGDNADQGPMQPLSLGNTRPQFSRSTSGSLLPFRPLSTTLEARSTLMDVDDSDAPELTSAETDDDEIEADFSWSDTKQHTPLINLEASGLGGTYPEDHFVIIARTRRPKRVNDDGNSAFGDDDETLSVQLRLVERLSQETTDSIINKLASMTTSSPAPRQVFDVSGHVVQIEYLPEKLLRLSPVPLPPPTFYFPGEDSDLDDDDDDDESMDSSSESESLMSRRAIVEDDPSSDIDLSGNDEEDEHSDSGQQYDASGSISPENIDELPDVSQLIRGSSIRGSERSPTTGSSAATAGGAASGYNSSIEDL